MIDRGLDSWTDSRSTRECVREIATTLTEPRSVEWVRKQAHVSSWETVNDELETLVEFGQLRAVDGDDGNTKYAPNYRVRYVEEVTELIGSYARDELRDEIASIQATIDEWKSEFDVDSRDDLESTLTDDDLDSEAIRYRNRVLRQWERHEDNKQLLEHALELYDDAREFHPGRDDTSSSSTPVSQ